MRLWVPGRHRKSISPAVAQACVLFICAWPRRALPWGRRTQDLCTSPRAFLLAALGVRQRPRVACSVGWCSQKQVGEQDGPVSLARRPTGAPPRPPASAAGDTWDLRIQAMSRLRGRAGRGRVPELCTGFITQHLVQAPLTARGPERSTDLAVAAPDGERQTETESFLPQRPHSSCFLLCPSCCL